MGGLAHNRVGRLGGHLVKGREWCQSRASGESGRIVSRCGSGPRFGKTCPALFAIVERMGERINHSSVPNEWCPGTQVTLPAAGHVVVRLTDAFSKKWENRTKVGLPE